MWVVRWILILLLLLFLLYFSILNNDQFVTVKFWKYQIPNVPLIMTLFVAFVVGAVSWFLVAVIQFIQTKTEMRGLRRENMRLQKELADLRNMSIEEDVPQPGEESINAE